MLMHSGGGRHTLTQCKFMEWAKKDREDHAVDGARVAEILRWWLAEINLMMKVKGDGGQ